MAGVAPDISSARSPMMDEHQLPPPPKLNRCTDFCCCLVLIANFVGMFYTIQYAFQEGNISKLTNGFDWRLKTCGVSEGVEDMPYLYTCASTVNGELQLSDGICVKHCPISTATTSLCPGHTVFLDPAEEDLGNGTKKVTTGIERTLTPLQDYPTKEVPLLKYCVPDADKMNSSTFAYEEVLNGLLSSKIEGEKAFTTAESILTQKKALPIAVTIAAIIFCYSFVYVMKYIVRFLVYIIVAAMGIVWIALALYVTFAYFHPDQSPLNRFTDNEADSKRATLITAIAVWAFSPVVICLLSCLLARMKLVIHAVQDAGNALMKMPTLLLLPLLQIVFQLAVVGGCIYGLLWVMSTGKVTPVSSINVYDPTSIVPDAATNMKRTVEWTPNEKWLIGYWIFSTVWLHQITLAAGKFVISYSVVKFKWNKHTCGTMICQGYLSAYTLHLGTISTGAFILGLLWVITGLMKFLLSQTTGRDGSPNKVAKILECCCVGCLACLARIVEFLNSMAYTECALTGAGYCHAAHKAFTLLISHSDTFMLVAFMTRVVKFAGVATVTIGGTWLVTSIQNNDSWQDWIDKNTHLDSGDIFMEQQKLGGQITAAVILFVVSYSFFELFDWLSNSLMYVILWVKIHHGEEAAEHTGSFTASDKLVGRGHTQLS